MTDPIVRRVHMPPPPATAVEMYLAAILDEMRALRELLAPRESPGASALPSAAVELREPLPATNKPKRAPGRS